MSWQPESTRWQQDRPGDDAGTAVQDGAGALVRPMLLGLAAGLGVALAGLVVVGVVVLGIGGGGSSAGGGLLVLAAGLGVPLLALAASLGAGLAGRRAATLRLRPGVARQAALGTGAAVGAVALALGIAPGLRWPTLPLYLAGVAAGTVLGARRATPGR